MTAKASIPLTARGQEEILRPPLKSGKADICQICVSLMSEVAPREEEWRQTALAMIHANTMVIVLEAEEVAVVTTTVSGV